MGNAIRSMENCINSIWDWGFLSDCLPGKMLPSDIDGIIERNGRFFVIETKSEHVERIPKGQYITLKRLQDTGLFTVIILYGDKTPTAMDVWYPKDELFGTWGQVTGKKSCGEEELKTLIRWWFKRVNGLSAAHVPLKPEN